MADIQEDGTTNLHEPLLTVSPNLTRQNQTNNDDVVDPEASVTAATEGEGDDVNNNNANVNNTGSGNDDRENDVDNNNNNSSTTTKDRNIPVMLWYQGVRCGAESIWTGSVLAAYVYMIQSTNPELIGYLSAIEGIVQFFAACLAGIVADYHHHSNNDDGHDGYDNENHHGDDHDDDHHHNQQVSQHARIQRPFCRRRDVLLRCSSTIGLTASILVMISCQVDTRYPTVAIICLGTALGLNGAFDGITLTVSLALFADTISDGDRSYYFTQRTLCTNIGQMMGPVVAVVMFYALGDHWTIPACGIVMQTAQLLLLPAFALLWCFHEIESSPVDDSTTPMQSDSGDEELQERLLVPDQDQGTQNTGDHDDDDENPSRLLRQSDDDDNQTSYHRSVAAGAALSDIIGAVASGISLRYYTLFFLDNLVLGPVIVNLLDTLSCVIGSMLLVVAQRTSLRFGRCSVSIMFKVLGTIFLLSMIGVYWWNENPTRKQEIETTSSWWKLTMSPTMIILDLSNEELDDNSVLVDVAVDTSTAISMTTKLLVCVLYLLQMAFLNSTGALTRSLVMDNVPSHERAKWSALESINIFGWCGSAAIGGMLVSWLGGVLPVFGISAGLQLIGILPLVLIVLCGKERLE